MLRLVDDLLDVSRITSGKIELARSTSSCRRWSRARSRCPVPLLERRRNRLTVEVPERGLVIDGDPSRLAQIVSNLLTNAAKYSDPDSSIDVRASREGAHVGCSSSITASASMRRMLDRVFDQFVQVPQGLDRAAAVLAWGSRSCAASSNGMAERCA